jgi:hypothetical protein
MKGSDPMTRYAKRQCVTTPKAVAAAFSCLVLLAGPLFAEQEDLNTEMMRATVKIGHEKSTGTGFFLHRQDPRYPKRSQFILVTAAHVFENIPGDVARFLGEQPDEEKHTVHLEVTHVLKGGLKPGKHDISFEDQPHIGAKGAEVVAFLDKDLVWRFVASQLNEENKVDQGVLQISGFYDSNAYFVTPGLITLDQLKIYLKEGSLSYRFRGEVYFPEPGKTGWKPGSLVLSGTYDVINNKASVNGLPNLKGFPAQPKVYIHSLDDSNLDLTYAPFLNRPLKLVGKVRGVDRKTGEMKVRFAVAAPEVMTQKTFEEYLDDPDKRTSYYRFKLTCAPTKDSTIPKAVFLTMGKWTEDKWDSTRLEGFGKAPINVFESSYNGPTMRSGSIGVGRAASNPLPKTMVDEGAKEDWVLRMCVKTETGDFLSFGFNIGEPNQDDDGFTWFPMNMHLYKLYRNPVKGTITLHDGKTARTVATFTTTLDSVGFNRIEKK